MGGKKSAKKSERPRNIRRQQKDRKEGTRRKGKMKKGDTKKVETKKVETKVEAKKGDLKKERRTEKAARLKTMLEENAELFEVRFMNENSGCVEWLEDVSEALARFVVASHSLTDKELGAQLTDETKLRALLLEDLHAHGVKDERDIAYICRLLRGLILSIGRKHGKEGNEDLVRWLFSGKNNSTPLTLLSSYHISEAEYAEMKQKAGSGAERLLTTTNQGGSHSSVSEAYSFELLNILLGNRIDLDKTETEIEYTDEQSKITDYSFQTLAGERFGVSVTRACGKEFGAAESFQLLNRKLHGVNESTKNVSSEHGWRKQLLHVWCESELIASLLKKCYDEEVEEEMKQETFVLLTIVANGEQSDEIFYANKQSTQLMRHGGITLGHVKTTHAKEIAKNRPTYDLEPTVSPAALACRTHAFIGESLGGLRCQICYFETSARVWKCSKGCDIALCGNCMDKWKKKINEY
eukprot:Phypoly_transcript_07644.p1 GENE.Phypoly_transcript_07644~~Phypoly_transcript_07644.p1  ORF type:complete len:467 (+),score=105.86 Phypoly_transcript_07644:143-1543(+)